jgi:hypothetical protein
MPPINRSLESFELQLSDSSLAWLSSYLCAGFITTGFGVVANARRAVACEQGESQKENA